MPRGGESELSAIIMAFKKSPLVSLAFAMSVGGGAIHFDPRFMVWCGTFVAVAVRGAKIPELFMIGGSYTNTSYVIAVLYCLLALASMETFMTSCGAVRGAPRGQWLRPSSWTSLGNPRGK